MYNCPHCDEATISAWQKLSAGKAMPAECTNCLGKSYIGIKDQIIAQALLSFLSLIFILPAIAFNTIWLIIGIIPLSILLLKPLLLSKPMQKAD